MKTQTSYQIEVLKANSEFKTALRTTNKAIKLLIASEVLSTSQVNKLKAILKNDASYKSFDSKVRRTPKGMVTPFYVLQALYKASKK